MIGILDSYKIPCPYLQPTNLELPYMYSTYKEEKQEHRYITAGDNSILALMATLVDTCLQTIIICETEQCLELIMKHLTSKGLEGKYMWRCKYPYTVGLNIPNTIPCDSQLLSIDAKECYDNIPLIGDHSLSTVISDTIFRAFQYKEKNLTVRTDLTRPGKILKVRWCSPSRGDKLRKLATQQWHETDVENRIHINLIHINIIRGDFLKYINPADKSCIGDDSTDWIYPTNIITIKDTSTEGVITGTQNTRATETTFLHMNICLSLGQGSTTFHDYLSRLKVHPE